MDVITSYDFTLWQSLPVAFGSEAAKWICVGAIDVTQISVAGILLLCLMLTTLCKVQDSASG